jgi:hypothetical protein
MRDEAPRCFTHPYSKPSPIEGEGALQRTLKAPTLAVYFTEGGCAPGISPTGTTKIGALAVRGEAIANARASEERPGARLKNYGSSRFAMAVA